jgi:uncharacterized protein YukE
MSSEVKIDLDKVADAAAEIKLYKGTLNTAITEINSIIDGLEKQYSSSNTKEILKKYSDLKKDMEELIKALDDYYEFLLKSKNLYESVEKKIANKLEQIVASTIQNAVQWL